MNPAAARMVARLWEGRGVGPRVARVVLAPAAGLWSGAVMLRDLGYRSGLLRRGAVAARVVSVGNLRVGGTGKTPVTRWLAAAAHARGVPTAIVSRGYGGTAVEPHVVGDGGTLASDVARSGDETVMLARTTGVPVVAGRDRLAAARLALARFGSRLLICDDAFQHQRLRRDVDVVLVDADERGGLLRLLPAGPLREPLRALGRADVVLAVTRGDGEAAPLDPVLARRHAIAARIRPVGLVRPGSDGWEPLELGALVGRRVLAVSGVARPGPFYEALHAAGAILTQILEYPDHHAYDTRTWQEIAHAARGTDVVVTTEKDLVKLERFPFARDGLLAIRLGVVIADEAALLARILDGTGA